MYTTRTQFLFYQVTVHSPAEQQAVVQFKSRYPQCQVRNKFSPEDYMGFYPMYYEVVVKDHTSLKLAFLLMFPDARLKSIVNSATQLIALG